jgi:hypothetical protein
MCYTGSMMSTKSRQNKGARRRQSSGFWGGRARQRAVGVSLGPKKINVRAFLPDASQPALGRFISRDPVGFAGGLNLLRLRRSQSCESYRSVGPIAFITTPDGVITAHNGAELLHYMRAIAKKGCHTVCSIKIYGHANNECRTFDTWDKSRQSGSISVIGTMFTLIPLASAVARTSRRF